MAWSKKATIPAAGRVKAQAQRMFLAIFQLTADNLLDSPTPRIDEVMMWVVLVGNPYADAAKITAADDVWTQNPWIGCSFTKSLPTVLMILHPPIAVPRAIAIAHAITTNQGTENSLRVP